MKIVIANKSHSTYAEIICQTIELAAQVRGTGIAKREPAYIITKMENGNAVIALDDDIFLTSPLDYVIISQASKEAEKVSVGKINMLDSSLLTKPNNMFPSYTLEGNNIKMYPRTINQFGQVEAVYFRHPKPPKWTYITLAGGTPVFDQSQSDYQDFELPFEDTYRLVMKILQYCGMSIREIEVAQFGIAQEQQNQL